MQLSAAQMQKKQQADKPTFNKIFDDRINSSGSDATETGSEQHEAKKDFIGGPGGWDFTEYMHQKSDYEIDITSVDVFSLARHGHFHELKAVLEHGVDPNSKDKQGNTILIVGAQNGNKAVCKLCLRHGALINMTNCVGNSALHFAVEFGYKRLSDYLLQKGANPYIKNIYGFFAKDGLRIVPEAKR